MRAILLFRLEDGQITEIGGVADRMQFLTQVPVDIISVIQALVLLFVAADAIVRYLYRIRARGTRLVLTRGWGG